MEMRAVPTFGDTINFKPAQDQFVTVADEGNTVNITHVECAILQVDANGLYQTAEGSTDADFATFASLSGSLDDAYKIGKTINTNNSQGDVVITGSEKLLVSATQGAAVSTVLSVGGLASLNGGIDVDSGAFAVADTSGNVTTTGTLGAGGLASLNGGISVDGAFTVADSTGNVATTGTLSSGAATLASAKVSDLTDGRVVLAGASGELEDDGNLTFDSAAQRLSVTGDVMVDTLKIDGGSITDSSGSISFDNENLSTTGTLSSGAATLASAKVSDLTSGRVVLAGAQGEIEDSANLLFNGSTLSVTGAVDASGSVAAGTMTIDSGSITDSSGAISFGDENLSTTGTLASGAATITGAVDASGSVSAGNMTIDSGSIVDSSGAISFGDENLSTTGTLSSGALTASSAQVSDLTDNEIVLAGTSGELEGDANFRFDGTNLDIGAAGSETFRVNVSSGSTTVKGNLSLFSLTRMFDGNGQVSFSVNSAGVTSIANTLDVDSTATLAEAVVEDITATHIVYAGTGGRLKGEAAFNYVEGTDTLTVPNVSVGTAATLASAQISDLTDNRITIAGASGELEDDANFRFDGTNFDIGAAGSEKFRVAVSTGDTTIAGGLDVTTTTGSIVLDSSGSANTNLRLKAAQGILLESHAVYLDHAGINVKNATASNISGGTVLYASGWDNTDNVSRVEAADSSQGDHPIGIAPHQHDAGQVRPMASVPGTYIDGLTIAGGGASGDAVYLNGTSMSTVAPNQSGHTVYRLGYLANPSGTAGQASMIWRPQFIAKIN
jgi:hypothetical protein